MSNENKDDKECEYLPEECLGELEDALEHLNQALNILRKIDNYKISHLFNLF